MTGLDESAMELLIFAEKALPAPDEGGVPQHGILAHLVRSLLPQVSAQARTVHYFPNVGADAGRFQGVRSRVMEFGRVRGRDFSDLFRHSITGRSFRHPVLGVGTIVKVVDREAQSQIPAQAAPSSPADVEDEFARLLGGEGPPESAPQPVVPPAPAEAGHDRAVVHLIVLAEELPEDERAQAAKEHRLPAGGQLEEVLRREVGYPLRDDLPVTVCEAGADQERDVDRIRALVTETGQAMGFDYADRSAFAVRSRGFRSDKLGRVLLVSVLRRPGAPAPLRPAQSLAVGEANAPTQEAPGDEKEAVREPAIAEPAPARETSEVLHIGDLPVLEKWRETPISQLPVLSRWEESPKRQIEDAGDDRSPAGRD